MKREESETVRMVMKINVRGQRGIGRHKRRKLDESENDIKIAGVYNDSVSDRNIGSSGSLGRECSTSNS